MVVTLLMELQSNTVSEALITDDKHQIIRTKRKSLHQLLHVQQSLMFYQPPYDRLEQQIMMPTRLRGSQRTTHDIQVPNMIQHTMHGGPMTHQSRRASSRKQRSDIGAPAILERPSKT